MSQFLDDFWRVSAIEDVEEYTNEWAALESNWPDAIGYLRRELKPKQKKWAFAYTHSQFVAGISSTQRQEQVNGQIKANLISNSSLSRIIEGFESVEKSIAARQLQAVLSTKLSLSTDDPIIQDALKSLTAYAGKILMLECALSLSYTCIRSEQTHTFRVSHKDFPHKFRLTLFDPETVLNSVCSCRKATWHGIVCRHLLCTMRQSNYLHCPTELFNPRWQKNYCSGIRPATVADVTFGSTVQRLNVSVTRTSDIPHSEDERISELASISKQVILRSVGDADLYKMIRAAYLSHLETVNASQNLRQTSHNEKELEIRNPLKARTKGRPKTGGKRYISIAERQQSKRKKSK